MSLREGRFEEFGGREEEEKEMGTERARERERERKVC